MNLLLTIEAIISLHQASIISWQESKIILCQAGFLSLVEKNHACNYQLWHAEDKARRDDLGYEFVYHAKREIDDCNQQRNNHMEAMDQWLFVALHPAAAHLCPTHSETPGMIIDRLSILALKVYYMHRQTKRLDVNAKHISSCKLKWQSLTQQQQQLFTCLKIFIKEVLDKTRRFNIYYQYKMYNDPNLNPELYNSQ